MQRGKKAVRRKLLGAAALVFFGISAFCFLHWAFPQKPENITNKMMLADYDDMWDNLEKNYPYFEAVYDTRGVKAQVMRDFYRKRIGNIEDGDIITYFNTVSDCLQEFHVGHLRPVSLAGYEYTRTRALASSNPQDGLEFYRNEVTANFYGQYAALSRLEAGDVASFTQQSADEYLDSVLSLTWSGDVPVVTIRSFQSPSEEGEEEMTGRLTKLLEACRNSGNLIIDVRGNGGGSTSPWANSFIPFVAFGDAKVTVYAAYKAGKHNLSVFSPVPVPGKVVRSSVDDLTLECWPICELEQIGGGVDINGIDRRDLQNLDYIVKSVVSYADEEMENPYTGKLWLLVDGECASAAGEFIHTMQQLCGATTVGVKTGGMSGIPFGPALTDVMLPRTGLLIQYQPTYVFNSDGTCRDFGLAPDITVPAGEDALDVCLAEIRR